MPGEEVWLVGERRTNGERKYYLVNLPDETPVKMLAATIKACWICEQAHQQLTEELGLARKLTRAEGEKESQGNRTNQLCPP
jgi:SRSO17 transposase